MPIAALNRLLGHVLRHQPDGLPLLRRAAGQPGAAAGHRPTGRRRRLLGVGRRHRDHERRQGGGLPVDQGGDPSRATRWPSSPRPTTPCSRCWPRSVCGPWRSPATPATGSTWTTWTRSSGRPPVAAVALVSNFSNPTGSCMSDDAKRRLVELLETHDVPLVEDDVYGELVFEGPRPNAIKAFDRRGLVLYCSSYSKTLSPGLRVGLGHPRPLPERGRAAQAGGQPGHAPSRPSWPWPPSSTAAGSTATSAGSGACTATRWRRRSTPWSGTSPRDPADQAAGWSRPVGAAARRRRRHGSLRASAVRRASGSRPDRCSRPSGGYRNFIRLNTGFPWTAVTERQIETLGKLVATARAPTTAA